MSSLLPIIPPTRAEKSLVGGKGAQLLKLVELGANVPPFLVIPTAVSQWTNSQGQFPEECWQAIEKEVKKWDARWVAVRSSVTGEDGQSASFAGLFETYLYVTTKDLKEKIQAAYVALNSDRVKVYCREKGITDELHMAVVVQKMLDPIAAGVAFSRSPIIPTADIVIDASWGVGEGVVSGLVETDHWRYSRLNEMLDERLSIKTTRLGSSPDGSGTSGFPVEAHLQASASLTLEERQKIVHEVLRIEKRLRHPVDIEFAFEGEMLYLLQVRPITQEFSPLKSYTDTNLAESYPGVTSPLTTSFVQIAYRNVFAESAIILGASSDRLKKLMPHYQSLIGQVNHHLYYDLEHYYAVIAALPGGEKNIENWHRMIGGKRDGMDVPMILNPPNIFEQLKAAFKLFAFICTHQRVLDRFAESLEAQKKILHDRLMGSSTSEETLRLLHQTLTRPLGFGLTIINDVVLMIGVKALAALLKTKGLGEDVLAPMLKTGDEVESLKPLALLEKVMSQIPEDFWPHLEASVSTAPEWGDVYHPIWNELEQKGWKKEAALLAGFLQQYGERSFEELKLESPTLRQSPKDFYRLLRFMRRRIMSAGLKQPAKTQFDVKSFSLPKQFAWKISWSVTKRAIFWREKTRLLRGQFYNVIREMLAHAAEQLRKDYPSFQIFKWRDYFNISLEEYQRFAEGKITNSELADLLEKNKSWQEAQGPFPEFLVTAVGETPFKSVELTPSEGLLIGQTAAPGKVEGRPLVLDSPEEALEIEDLSNCILVTRHTDPAWVYIMSQCRGLISEKGSLLSHTAIIGRELGIPTVVGIRGAVNQLRGIPHIILNADEGKVEISGN
ncbi:MAG: PEP/pyruvate-binding domain-containing protein [Bacteriovoracia bacterium]